MSTMFDPETPVLVRFPITSEQHDGDRAAWPWLPGVILAQVDTDEWDVMVTARELATLDDGSPAPDSAHWADLCYPWDDVLAPVAEAVMADLYLPTGEMSDTLIYKLAQSAIEDGRPLALLYFSDCDPAGWQMPISVARKLQAFAALLGPFDFQVHRVALTPAQAREYDLPSTPLKATEKRGDAWRRETGTAQTEIDALALLRPDLLRRIATDAIAPFWDDGLGRRVAQARAEWLREATVIIDRDTDSEMLARVRAEAARQLAGIRHQISALNDHRFHLARVDLWQCKTEHTSLVV